MIPITRIVELEQERDDLKAKVKQLRKTMREVNGRLKDMRDAEEWSSPDCIALVMKVISKALYRK